jgi:small subunit ribosomal protein S2
MGKEIDIRDLYEAGAQFGHKTSRWHPKMAEFIHSARQESHIIDLEKTVAALEKALPEVKRIAGTGKKILFVGTKKQIKEVIRTIAERVGQPYVTERWVGGTLTNAETINSQIKKLVSLEKRMASGELEKRYSKLEVQRYQEEIDALNERYGGVKDLSGRPAAVIVFGAHDEKNAVKEARILGIPVFAMVDTNTDPTGIDFVIPANDDAIKSVQLIAEYFADAIADGMKNIKKVEE